MRTHGAFVLLLCAWRAFAQKPGPVDPPFDLTRVLFSAVFSDHMVLQRAPQVAAVFGTAAPGGAVTVTLTGPAGFTFTSPPAPVARSPDAALHGTWKVLLPARPAGFNYTVAAACEGCANTTTAVLADVGFGDVFLCSGQSNMECPVLTTLGRQAFYNRSGAGEFDHIRLFQTGYRYLGPRNASSWILPALCEPSKAHACPTNTETSGGGYAYRSWVLPRGQGGDDPDGNAAGFPDRFSAVCFYFGAALSDARGPPTGGADPVPIGLVASTIGGTTIQEWLPPWATGNGTCTENNCGWVEQLSPSRPVQPATQPQCANASLANVWTCPSGVCSTLWHSLIAPYANMSVAGFVWYQGEQNQVYNGGNSTSGYLCQQNALIDSWRATFSATPGTTPRDAPFGVTSLAGGGGEGFPLWSPSLHASYAEWLNCSLHRSRTPACQDLADDSMGLLRRAQAGGAGAFPAGSNVFLGQAHDLGEPCLCDKGAQPPGGCWANGECYGAGPYSLNLTWNFQNSGIHPRPKQQIGQRLARGFLGLQAGGASAAKLSGCRLDAASGALTITFDAGLLRGEALSVQAGVPGLVPLQVRVGPPSDNSSGWVYALALRALNTTTVAVDLPPGVAQTATAVRYAWADVPCCPGINTSTYFCPAAACPLVTSEAKEPAVPFWASIVGGKCVCEAPWVCDA